MTMKRELVDGRMATVVYLNDRLEPCEPSQAKAVRVYHDDGSSMIGFPTTKKADRAGVRTTAIQYREGQ